MQAGNKPDYLNPEFSRFLQTVTKYVSKPLGFNKIYNEEQLKKREVEYASSLPLQIILYFNVFYSIIWIIGTSFLWPILVYVLNETNRVWIILILFAFIMMVIFEIVRLYLAYLGNLCERVPELTGFWLLTLMVQLPLCTFLVVIAWINIGTINDSNGIQIKTLTIVNLMPLQWALQLLHSIFVYLEVIFGFFALRVLARYQISRFHYKQFDETVTPINDNENNEFSWLTNLDKTSNIYMKTLNSDYKTH